jgi:hypothetical protein
MEMEIRTNDLYLRKCGIQPIKLPIKNFNDIAFRILKNKID